MKVSPEIYLDKEGTIKFCEFHLTLIFKVMDSKVITGNIFQKRTFLVLA